MENRPIRILYFTSFFVSQGGASLSFLKLLEAFNRGTFEAFAILPEEARPQIRKLKLAPGLERRITYIPLDRISRQLLHPWRFVRFCLRAVTGVIAIRRFLRAWQIELVHANDLRDFHAPVAARLCKVPVVWHLRASRPNPLTRYPVATMIHLLATKIVAVSHCTGQQMLFKRSYAQGKVAVIYNPGPYRDRFHPGIDGSAIRREFDIPENVPLITMIGKLSQRKGHVVFVKAVPIILEKFSRAHFLIVGGELEGHENYARALRDLSEKFVRAGRLIFTGERSDVPRLMAASDVIVQCSLCQDAFPGVVLEGMAVGRAVVACRAGGIPEQITDGEDGVLFEMGNAEDLAQKVIALLSDSGKMRALQQAAVVNLEHKFNFHKFEKGFGDLYRSLSRTGRAFESNNDSEVRQPEPHAQERYTLHV